MEHLNKWQTLQRRAKGRRRDRGDAQREKWRRLDAQLLSLIKEDPKFAKLMGEILCP